MYLREIEGNTLRTGCHENRERVERNTPRRREEEEEEATVTERRDRPSRFRFRIPRSEGTSANY